MDSKMERDRLEKLGAQLSDREPVDGGWAQQLQRVLGLLTDLEMVATELEDRLGVVLREPEPEAPTPGMTRTPPITQLAAHLENVGDQLEGLRVHLTRTCQRVEL